ncbi:MAG: tRNA uridine-5-carboxymethylaminomethyl(34) synthesis GTPase MnmE, partial [Clostridia bacterium]|nr:tRNA uridine-5-carboxymethylaminomethyl(34) synthesis GTPase MnmE [Clostridia bacterium]
LSLSAKDESSFDVLREALESLLGTAEFDSSAALLINERQLACCNKAVECINEAIDAIDAGLTMDAVNVSVDAAISPLLELTGERVSDAVVNEVFSRFCVGK